MIISQAEQLLRVKAMMKELEEEKEMLIEEIVSYMERSNEEKLFFDVSDDEHIVVEKKYRLTDKLDKESLSLDVKISQEEMKTPFDWSKLTDLKKITPHDISRHTHPTTSWSVKVSKSKKPKRKATNV